MPRRPSSSGMRCPDRKSSNRSASPRFSFGSNRTLLSEPLDYNQRIHFIHNAPARHSSTPEKLIHGSHRPVVSGWPATLEHSRFMEQRQASGRHEAAPVRPILMDRGFFVVSVNKKQINWFRPVSYGLMAEFLNPHRPAVPKAHDRGMGGEFQDR